MSEKTNVKIDAIDIDRQVKYQIDGLTRISNNQSVVPRDANGNISLQENVTTNPLLIIEPMATKITTKSMLRVLDTQFKYFKFPARTSVIEEEPVDLDFDLTLDPVFARYQPSEDRKILTGDVYSGILMDTVVDGWPQSSINSYTISKEIKNSGVDLRFRIKLQHRYDNLDAGSGSYGTAYFSIIKSDDNELNREYRTFENTSPFVKEVENITTTVDANGKPITIKEYGPLAGSINDLEVQNATIDFVIPNSEFEIGDLFRIGAKAGQNNDTQYHTINSHQSYWVISDASKNVDLWNQDIPETEVVNEEIETSNDPREIDVNSI